MPDSLTPDRWEEIKAILGEALSLEPGERDELICSRCGDDREKFREVISLLAQHGTSNGVNVFSSGFVDLRNIDEAISAAMPLGHLGLDCDSNTSSGRSSDELRGGRFQIKSEYARGGLGVVYLAYDHELKRDVAVKEIQKFAEGSKAIRERFIREARITGQLEHSGVAPVYGFGRHSDGAWYYAMKLVLGTSMAKAIEDFHRNGLPGRPSFTLPDSVDYSKPSSMSRTPLNTLISVRSSIAISSPRISTSVSTGKQ